jgi:hypothetical protein
VRFSSHSIGARKEALREGMPRDNSLLRGRIEEKEKMEELERVGSVRQNVTHFSRSGLTLNPPLPSPTASRKAADFLKPEDEAKDRVLLRIHPVV